MGRDNEPLASRCNVCITLDPAGHEEREGSGLQGLSILAPNACYGFVKD